MQWPDRISLIGATIRKKPAAEGAKCAINGVKDAERVYVTDAVFERAGKRISYPLCFRHAQEWAAMKEEVRNG